MRCALTPLAVVALAAVAVAQPAAPSVGAVSDRLGLATSPRAAPAGVLYVEVGASETGSYLPPIECQPGRSCARTYAYRVPVGVRYGVSERVEVRAGALVGVERGGARDHLGAAAELLEAGVKLQLLRGERLTVAFAQTVGVLAEGGGEFQARSALSAGVALAPGAEVVGTLGIEVVPPDSEAPPSASSRRALAAGYEGSRAVLVARVAVTPWASVYGQAAAFRSRLAADRDRAYAGGGVLLRVGRAVLVDAGLDVGLNEAAGPARAGLGVTVQL